MNGLNILDWARGHCTEPRARERSAARVEERQDGYTPYSVRTTELE